MQQHKIKEHDQLPQIFSSSINPLHFSTSRRLWNMPYLPLAEMHTENVARGGGGNEIFQKFREGGMPPPPQNAAMTSE